MSESFGFVQDTHFTAEDLYLSPETQLTLKIRYMLRQNKTYGEIASQLSEIYSVPMIARCYLDAKKAVRVSLQEAIDAAVRETPI